jgi:hypothetical protein
MSGFAFGSKTRGGRRSILLFDPSEGRIIKEDRQP